MAVGKDKRCFPEGWDGYQDWDSFPKLDYFSLSSLNFTHTEAMTCFELKGDRI